MRAMRLAIGNILNAAQLEELRRHLEKAAFGDGRRTAGAAARQVKNNLQLDPASPAYKACASVVLAALQANETFQTAALPRAMSGPLFSRYEPGMGYGAHVDNALMRGPDLRSDLAYTLFLSEPSSYEGGELVLMEAEGENAIKLPAGTLFLYAATALHRVENVTAGRRDVCVGWVQSLVRDERVREMIFDLSQAKARLEGQADQKETRYLIAKTQSNLLRLHAEV